MIDSGFVDLDDFAFAMEMAHSHPTIRFLIQLGIDISTSNSSFHSTYPATRVLSDEGQ